ncbi:MAG: hypothetical protein ACK5MR_05105 [Cumulibacter sp.]
MKNAEWGDNALDMEKFYKSYGIEVRMDTTLSSHGMGYSASTEENEFSTALLGIVEKTKTTGGEGIRSGDTVGP